MADMMPPSQQRTYLSNRNELPPDPSATNSTASSNLGPVVAVTAAASELQDESYC
jgi:hypothetical protein